MAGQDQMTRRTTRLAREGERTWKRNIVPLNPKERGCLLVQSHFFFYARVLRFDDGKVSPRGAHTHRSLRSQPLCLPWLHNNHFHLVLYSPNQPTIGYKFVDDTRNRRARRRLWDGRGEGRRKGGGAETLCSVPANVKQNIQ